MSLRERFSVAIRRRLPRKTADVDPVYLLSQLPTEDVVTTGRLITSIRRNRPDQDLGFKAKGAWDALVEAKKAQEREPDQDYSELISQAQLQHGYAFGRELDSDAKKARYIKYAKNTAWALTIIGPVIEGAVALIDELNKQMRENDAINRAFREAQIQDQIRANNDPKNRAYWEQLAKGPDSK